MTVIYIAEADHAVMFKFFKADELVKHVVGPSDCIWIVPGTYDERD
jgi:hypothetical protein